MRMRPSRANYIEIFNAIDVNVCFHGGGALEFYVPGAGQRRPMKLKAFQGGDFGNH
jgi:hypothetical protein